MEEIKNNENSKVTTNQSHYDTWKLTEIEL